MTKLFCFNTFQLEIIKIQSKKCYLTDNIWPGKYRMLIKIEIINYFKKSIVRRKITELQGGIIRISSPLGRLFVENKRCPCFLNCL